MSSFADVFGQALRPSILRPGARIQYARLLCEAKYAMSRKPGILSIVVVTTLLIAGAASGSIAQEPPAETEGRVFGAEYSTLSDVQKPLIDDIFVRFGKITEREIDPEEAYNQLRLSVRTTFDAVTHALSTSRLTDAETGEDLGTPLDLIKHLEAVNGKIKGAGGDRQFRLYVELNPGSREVLDRSAEFAHKGNNTIFHKGYPHNYRQSGGTPSIQFSLSMDADRADIDVDYRASKFPNALVNGHLTAANSDIRAGNHGRHSQRWDGLVNWWDGLLGLFSGKTYEGENDDDHEFPVIPRAGDKTIDVAVHDFLSSWLVEQRLNLSIAYVDRDAYDCFALRLEEEGMSMDRGLAPIQLYMNMRETNKELGELKSLEGATIGVRIANRNLPLVRQPNHRQYVILGVPADIAETLKCGSYAKIADVSKKRQLRQGEDKLEHFLSTFFINGARGRGATLSLLWAKREGFWKVISYEVEADARVAERGMPDVRTKIETAEVRTVAGDPTLIATVERFHEAWLVEKKYDEVFGLFMPSTYVCVNLNLAEGQETIDDPEEQRSVLRAGIQRLGDFVGEIDELEDVLDSVEPWDPRVRVIEHPRGEAFGMMALPDWAGEQADCKLRVAREGAAATEGENKSFGRYFASALRVDTSSGQPAILCLGWVKQDSKWRIFSYKVENP